MTFLPSAITPLALLILCLAIFGAAFFLVGTIGLLRLPDFFCRVHAATKCDTLGAGAVLLAMALFSGWGVDAAKIIALLLLVLIYSPTCGHALARASYRTGQIPLQESRDDTLCEKPSQSHVAPGRGPQNPVATGSPDAGWHGRAGCGRRPIDDLGPGRQPAENESLPGFAAPTPQPRGTALNKIAARRNHE